MERKEKVLEMVVKNVFDILSFPVCVYGSACLMLIFSNKSWRIAGVGCMISLPSPR